jgi:hypothetical protein
MPKLQQQKNTQTPTKQAQNTQQHSQRLNEHRDAGKLIDAIEYASAESTASLHPTLHFALHQQKIIARKILPDVSR